MRRKEATSPLRHHTCLGGLYMNILLIYPEFPDTFWSYKHALKFVGKRAGSDIKDSI
jgi:hypothetical protein